MLNNYFYFFFILIILCSIAVIISHNPIQSVYFLVLVFVFSSVLFIILGAEFLAILVIIIYVGAISILFLFVVMMLNLRVMELYSTFYNYLPIGSFLGLFFFFEFIYVINIDFNLFKSNFFYTNDFIHMWFYTIFYKGNANYLGYVLYKFFNHFVIISSLILLVSMLGSIILTVDFEYRAKKKNVYLHVKRDISTVSFWNSKISKP